MTDHGSPHNTSAWLAPLLGALVAVIIIGFLLRIIHQIYFHPLSKIPGPKLAAVTTLFEGYVDVSTKGRYLWKIKEWHQQYGKS